MKLTDEKFKAAELLFSPQLGGLDWQGVHHYCNNAIKHCGMDIRQELTNSIVLAGGSTMFKDFAERLEMEMK